MSIEDFWNKVQKNGIKITEYKEKPNFHFAFYEFNHQTYMLDMNQEGKISKETPRTWESMVANMQED